MSATVLKVVALCLGLAGVTGVATFIVATHIAPGEHSPDPRVTHGRFGW